MIRQRGGVVKRHKLTEILIETVETIVIRRRPASAEALLTVWCEQCGQVVNLLSPDAAAALTGISTRAVFRQIEARQLHLIEANDDRLWLCAYSVQQANEPSHEQSTSTKEI